MTTKDEALRKALEALDSDNPDIQLRAAIIIRGVLAQHDSGQAKPEPEPVAWMYVNTDGECEQIEYGKPYDDPSVTPLYTTPPQRNPLTMQPIIKDERGVLRFKKNGLVDALYEHGVKTGLGLNELHCMSFTDEDRQQFAQLIGYSVSGYGSLSYVTDEAYELAEQAAHGIYAPTELKE